MDIHCRYNSIKNAGFLRSLLFLLLALTLALCLPLNMKWKTQWRRQTSQQTNNKPVQEGFSWLLAADGAWWMVDEGWRMKEATTADRTHLRVVRQPLSLSLSPPTLQLSLSLSHCFWLQVADFFKGPPPPPPTHPRTSEPGPIELSHELKMLPAKKT